MDVDSIRRDVEDACERQLATAMAADTDGLGELIADDVLYSHGDGIAEDKAAYLARVARGLYLTIDMKHTAMHVRVLSDDIAVSRATMVSNSTPESAYRMDNLESSVLNVWARRDGRWQIVEHHVTLLRTPHS